MHFDHINNPCHPLTPAKSPTPLSSFQLHVFFLNGLLSPICTWVWGCLLRLDWPMGLHPWRKPVPSSHQLFIDPYKGRLVMSLSLSLLSQFLTDDLLLWILLFFLPRQGAQAGLEFVSLLLQSPECLGYWPELWHLTVLSSLLLFLLFQLFETEFHIIVWAGLKLTM